MMAKESLSWNPSQIETPQGSWMLVKIIHKLKYAAMKHLICHIRQSAIWTATIFLFQIFTYPGAFQEHRWEIYPEPVHRLQLSRLLCQQRR